MQKQKKLRIGAGAGYSGDRITPAVELAEHGDIQYLIFECLAERTIALAQQRKQQDPAAGFDPLLEARMLACLPACRRHGVKIISNMGAANPEGAARQIAAIAGQLGISGLKIAAVLGDDVCDLVRAADYTILETGEPLSVIRDQIISANAYLGAGPIVEALQAGADIVITGRTADPALFLAPVIYEFGWRFEDHELLGKGTVLGHLLECAGQVTGGYFADPGYKEVPDQARLGFPIAEVTADGEFVITKLPQAGGMVTVATCKEQLLYEIHDPARYLTPDVVADFTQVRMLEVGKDRVQITGGTGHPRTGKLKVSVGFRDGYIGEGQIAYGGPGAVQRGQLALDIVRQRLIDIGLQVEETRFELIGVNSLYGSTLPPGDPVEIRARVAARTKTLAEAVLIGNEVEALYTNGPAGGSGVTRSATEVIAIHSILIDAARVKTEVWYLVI